MGIPFCKRKGKKKGIVREAENAIDKIGWSDNSGM
jgi:hypothetical protein